MKAQNYSYTLYKVALMLSAFLLLSKNVFGNEILDSVKITEKEKRSESIQSRNVLPKWIEDLPSSIPQWMKISASKYRGSPHQVVCAVVKMAKALVDMKAAQARNCDSYFRCRGSSEAAQCGVYAAAFANHMRYKPQWRKGVMDKNYDSRADLFGSSGGNCLQEYKYKTYGTAHECNLPWNYHK